MAVHLVTDGGDALLDRTTGQPQRVTDHGRREASKALRNIAGTPFSIIRDSAIFDAAVISRGRFGVIASLVLRVVPQYCLHEHRVLETWSEVKRLLNGPHDTTSSILSISPQTAVPRRKPSSCGASTASPPSRTGFLQIAVNMCPHNINEHRVGISQRWFAAHSSPEAKNPDGSMRVATSVERRHRRKDLSL